MPAYFIIFFCCCIAFSSPGSIIHLVTKKIYYFFKELAEMNRFLSYTRSYELLDPGQKFWIRIWQKGLVPAASGSVTLVASRYQLYWTNALTGLPA
jgi:hypothetical protein